MIRDMSLSSAPTGAALSGALLLRSLPGLALAGLLLRLAR